MDEPSVIYTLDNEPYLGRESVFRLSQVITGLMDVQRAVATWTRSNTLGPLQRAVS